METIKILSHLESDRLMIWAHSQIMCNEFFGGKPTCRHQRWWGTQAEFYISKSYIKPAKPIEADPYLELMRDEYAPGCNSILLYRYEKGGFIGSHRDKLCFQSEVILINLIDAEPNLLGQREPSKFQWNQRFYYLQHGELIKFDSRVEHAIPPLKTARYSLQFRKLA